MISGGVHVVNVGLPLLAAPHPDALQLDWRPPAFGDVAAARAMVALDDEHTAAANDVAMDAVCAVRGQWTEVRPARDVVAALAGTRMLLHAGPPIDYQQMCAPMKGALIGACLFEGWASQPDEAMRLLERGDITLAACHDHGAVGPMAGVVSPSMPMIVVRDGQRMAAATLNEGLGKVLRFGAFDETVINRLRWMAEVLGPALDRAVAVAGPVDVTSLIGQALTMGDEGHNRNVAASSLLVRKLAAALASGAEYAAVLDFLAGNDHFALNLSMAAAKLALDAAATVENSTVVTAMCRNGVEFGIRVAGTGHVWFTAPVGPADGLFFPGYCRNDANPDLGDSAITETLGLGGFAMAAAPAITRFVGGSPADAIAATEQMGQITVRPHPAYPLPSMGFRGVPSGIDVLRVLDTGILPVINTGIAHREAGIGQIGAGIVTAPPEVFITAALAIAQRRGIK